MPEIGLPRFPSDSDNYQRRRSRLCLLGAVGYPPMIYALNPDSDGDLRAAFALQMGLCPSQVRIRFLTPGGIYEIGALIQGWTAELPVLVSTDPERWSDGSGDTQP